MSERLEAQLPGLGFSFSQPIELRMAELISGSRSDVAVTIYGDDLAGLERASLAVQRALRGVAGAADVRGEQLAGLPTLEVSIDRLAASRYSVARSIGTVASTTRVMPAASIARWCAASLVKNPSASCAARFARASDSTRLIPRSMSSPSGTPPEPLEIKPPDGSDVPRPMPASSSARLFATAR